MEMTLRNGAVGGAGSAGQSQSSISSDLSLTCSSLNNEQTL